MNILNKVTFKTLQKNKTRTLVTIIGIILSASMITAVTTCVSSLRNYLIETVIANDGDWHGAVYDVSKTQIEELKKDAQLNKLTSLQSIGYAKLSKSQNEYKPYLFLAGIEENIADILPVKLIRGRMPQNSSELLLPKHLQTNGGVNYDLGAYLSLSVGDRISDGYKLNQNNGYLAGESGETEELSVKEQRVFTVVGFYERPSFENYSAPGYTALTVADEKDTGGYDTYIKLNSGKNIYNLIEKNFPKKDARINYDLLRFSGASNDKSFNATLYSLAGILVGIIMFGSISLIYNAFSISVSERTKQFGLLSSVGATKKQMLRTVLTEASFLSVIGIPLGILAGIAGIGITLKLTEDLFSTFLSSNSDIVLALTVSWEAVISAMIIGFITVLLSAYIPAKRASKVSAIDAIRQVQDIKINSKKIKTPKLVYKLFGFEGMIASKNFKRNKKKYRSTVISLFMSIVLFISASSFCAYLSKTAGSVIDESEYDLQYSFHQNSINTTTVSELYKELSALQGVKEIGYLYGEYQTMKIPMEMVDKKFKEYLINNLGDKNLQNQAEFEVHVMINFVDDATYSKYLTANSLDKNIYMNSDNPKAIALDFVKYYNSDEGRYYTFNLLNTKTLDATMLKIKEFEGYYYSGSETDNNGNSTYLFTNNNKEEMKKSVDEATEKIALEIGTTADAKPFCVNYNYGGITLIYPFQAISQILNIPVEQIPIAFYFKAENHKVLHDKIYNLLVEKNLPVDTLFNHAEVKASDRALIAVLNIFSYGFIVLISLIAAANVFNTISTNIALRRREFAMLKSIGMTRSGFHKMMNYECLLYGIKGIIYGIPVSIVVTYLIYRSILNGLEITFFIPWYSIAIAVGSVFAVVFATMLYSMQIIKKDNPIDALKNENL